MQRLRTNQPPCGLPGISPSPPLPDHESQSEPPVRTLVRIGQTLEVGLERKF